MTLLHELRSSDRRWELGMINGPNMPNLGRRDRRVYGAVENIEELVKRVERLCAELGITLRAHVCSNSEAEILGWIHEHGPDLDGLIVNPAGLTTFGEATRHALEDTGRPFVEVHFGNIARRAVESRFSSTAAGACFGLRRHSYAAAVVGLVGALDGDDIAG